MRIIYILLTVAAVVVCDAPGVSFALNNKVEASYVSGSSEGSWEEIDMSAFTLSYTRYFQALSDDVSPYGAREFLQHPSYIGGCFAQTESEGYLKSLSVMEIDQKTDDYTVSGMFYAGDDRSTGLGLRYKYRDGEAKGTYPSVIREESLAFTIHQYLTDSIRIGLDYERRNRDEPLSDLDVYTVDAIALIEKYRLSGWYRYMDTDNERMGVEFGVYPKKKLGMFVSYEIAYEYMDFASRLKLKGEYWISRRTNASIVYEMAEADSGDSQADTVMLRLGLLF